MNTASPSLHTTDTHTALALRVLYVEDNRVNAIIFEQSLAMCSTVEMRIAEDGQEAIGLAQNWHPDVLVLDAHLPDCNGVDLLQRLRRLSGFESMPAFMCSADDVPENLSELQAAGFQGYWAKPIDVDRVLTDLRALNTTNHRSS